MCLCVVSFTRIKWPSPNMFQHKNVSKLKALSIKTAKRITYGIGYSKSTYRCIQLQLKILYCVNVQENNLASNCGKNVSFRKHGCMNSNKLVFQCQCFTPAPLRLEFSEFVVNLYGCEKSHNGLKDLQITCF